MEFCKPLFDRTSFYRELNAKLHNRQIVYLGAHAGWGKTIAAQEWIREYGNALLISAPMLRDFPKSQKKPSVLVIDDLQELSDAELQRDLLPLLAEAPQNQFVLIGRAELPSPLCLLQRAGQLAVLDQNALCLSRDVIDTYLAQTGLPYSVETSDYLMKESKGYPVAVDCLAELLRDGASCTEQTAQTAAQEIFRYFEHAVFMRLSREAQAFLLNIAQFHAFTLRMASTLNGDHEVVRILEEITHRGKCVFLRSPEHYGVPPLFHRFLIHCQKRMLSGEAIDNLWRRAGLYYEMSDEIPNALACYRQVNDWDKVMEILIRHTRRPPYTTFYFELKEFYLALPPALIERYPELMCSLSMIYSMNMQEKESEFWYDRLVCFSRSAGINESERKTAQERLAFLRIGLPHRGSRKIAQTIMDVIRLIHNEDRCVQGVSPTSGIPSLMHGAKDFCNWSKRNEQLYRLMKRPIELLLGKAGVGVADAGLAESKLECCTPQNITDVMRYATSAINQTEQSGTLDVYFAAVASMIRLAVMRGNVASAHKNLDCVEKKAQAEGNVRLLQNVRAFRTRIFLWEGKTARLTDGCRKRRRTSWANSSC